MPPSNPVATLPEETPDRPAARADREGVALAIAWCEGGASRTGEIAMVPAAPRVLGRGGPAADDPHPRLAFVRDRGGAFEPAPPLSSSHLSRVQLRLSARDDGSVDVVNLGKLRLSLRGAPVTEARLVAGDVLELGAQLLLVVVRRPLPSPRARASGFAFGAADAHGIVGESRAAWALRDAVAFVGAHEGHALVHGASGTGKELVARAVHALSPGRGGPFVARNAATFPEALIDAELFGNARNYPNPGTSERAGLIGEADGGTLFLDEFAELPAALQAHLLRVLDAGEYHRLGEARARTSAFRLVAATNRPRTALKEDVLARLVHRIEVPDLGARVEDVPLLASHLFLQMVARDPSLRGFCDPEGHPRFTMALVRSLLERVYATNVRELQGILWRAVAASHGAQLEPPTDVEAPSLLSPAPQAPPPAAPGDDLSPARIQAALDANNGLLEATWRALGLPSRHALARLVKKHGLEVRRRSRP